MSSIAGVLNLGAEKIEHGIIEGMLHTVLHRGADSTQIEENIDPHIKLGQALLHTTPDAKHRRIKYEIHGKSYFIVLDGRLDDRDTLIEQFDLENLEQLTDSELIVRSYAHWGELFLEKLEGDFAFGLWDSADQKLILARDRTGMRNLFYSFVNQTILWGSEIKQILQNQSVSRRLNESYLLTYLIEYPSALEDTAYSAVKRLEPGHYVLLRNGQLQVKKYYSFRPFSLSYRTELDYIEHFYSLFQQAIKNCTRSSGTIGFTLSGGLDSSSIVSMAAKLRKEGELPQSTLRCYSLIFDHFTEADERTYIAAVREKYPELDYEFTSGDKHWNFNEGTFEYLSELDEPFFLFNQSFSREIPKKMQKDNVKIHIGGFIGDHVLMGNENYLALLLKRFKIFRLFRELSKLKKHDYLLRDLLMTHTFKPLFAKEAQRPLPSWIVKETQDEYSLSNMLSDSLKSTERFTWDEQNVTDYFEFIIRQSGHEWSNQYVEGKHAVEIRYPFLNRKLMEFLAGTPVPLKWKPGQTKYILRQAMKNILPEQIAQRKGKTTHDSFIYAGLKKEWGKIQQYYTCPALSELGFIDGQTIQNKFDQYYVGMKPNAQEFVGLLRVLSLEIWLQKHS